MWAPSAALHSSAFGEDWGISKRGLDEKSCWHLTLLDVEGLSRSLRLLISDYDESTIGQASTLLMIVTGSTLGRPGTTLARWMDGMRASWLSASTPSLQTLSARLPTAAHDHFHISRLIVHQDHRPCFPPTCARERQSHPAQPQTGGLGWFAGGPGRAWAPVSCRSPCLQTIILAWAALMAALGRSLSALCCAIIMQRRAENVHVIGVREGGEYEQLWRFYVPSLDPPLERGDAGKKGFVKFYTSLDHQPALSVANLIMPHRGGRVDVLVPHKRPYVPTDLHANIIVGASVVLIPNKDVFTFHLQTCDSTSCRGEDVRRRPNMAGTESDFNMCAFQERWDSGGAVARGNRIASMYHRTLGLSRVARS
ncbi:hypothetical protein CONPUDRAFT_73712 [Coniophora puteana RWD-64-598 SS2]|uniref:Uncharacterized protein n=1 Tax=Coniophora puteana (strain RWD-64-598) TaxID=741705 RepID=A0A5M3MNJ9_CONPW|nr:uncharacterized protein CONPUDRAFT_73712 [Coniophora puteana RWD-64-598 SS2]EIW80627.1 hypothetical protein CONPUDRAFT_73712 [Coniophora puteana RWD-64-598 SS2]